MTVTITLYRSEIDYDIGMITHVVANRALAAGATFEQAYNYSNTDDFNGEANLVMRFEESAINELIAALGRYLPETIISSNNSLSIAEVESFDFPFVLPDTFNLSFVRPLRSAMHDYVVNRTLFEWFKNSKPDEAVNYRDLYEDALGKTVVYLNKRTKPVRIKPYPRI